MGVLTDYFHAPDDGAVREQMVRHDGGPLVGVESAAYDGVELKSIDPDVILGQLIGFAAGRPYSTGIIGGRTIWPADPAADPEYQGPWVSALGDEARDVLAGIPAGRVPELAERWFGIEEFRGLFPVADLRVALDELIALAVRARASGESLYCWISL